MKKLIVILSLLSSSLFAQKPEKIYSIVKDPKSQEFYNTQAKLWGEEVKKRPKNASAWMNYYLASRYDNQMYLKGQPEDKSKLMQSIVDGMKKNVPNSIEYYECALQTDKGEETKDTTQRVGWLKKGYAIAPNNPGILEEYVNHCEINNQPSKLKELYTHLYSSKTYDIGFIEFDYNMLMSLDKNAILFTSGDGDTYPTRILQEVKGVREDVTVINAYLACTYPDMLKRLLKEKNITMPDELLKKGINTTNPMAFIKELSLEINKKYPDAPLFYGITCDLENFYTDSLYCTGLAWKYSPKPIDNISKLKNNIENHFHLDYLDDNYYENNSVSEEVTENLHVAYVTPFAILYRHYKSMGESNDRTEFYKNFIMTCADKMGKKEEMEKYLDSK